MAYLWDPWRGCHRCSPGCLHCYIHKGDLKRNVDTNQIVLTEKFRAPIARDKKGNYKMKSGLVYVCFSSDFLIEEADSWREECFQMMKERSDLHFLFLTKRIERFSSCFASCIGESWLDSLTVGCTVENQEACDYKLPIFKTLPIKHKNIILQPLLEEVNIEPYLEGVELVVLGGESDKEARAFNLDWAKDVRNQCIKHKVGFEFRQCGSNYIKDGKTIRLNPFQLTNKAKEENLSYKPY